MLPASETLVQFISGIAPLSHSVQTPNVEARKMRRDELNGEIQRLPGPEYSERSKRQGKVSDFSEGSHDTVGCHSSGLSKVGRPSVECQAG